MVLSWSDTILRYSRGHTIYALLPANIPSGAIVPEVQKDRGTGGNNRCTYRSYLHAWGFRAGVAVLAIRPKRTCADKLTYDVVLY